MIPPKYRGEAGPSPLTRGTINPDKVWGLVQRNVAARSTLTQTLAFSGGPLVKTPPPWPFPVRHLARQLFLPQNSSAEPAGVERVWTRPVEAQPGLVWLVWLVH
jgi:hypothetical protein